MYAYICMNICMNMYVCTSDEAARRDICPAVSMNLVMKSVHVNMYLCMNVCM